MAADVANRTNWRRSAGVTLCGLLVVALATWGVHIGRKASKGRTCLNNLQALVRAFSRYCGSAPEAPFATSDEAIRAMVDAGLIDEGKTVSPFTGDRLAMVLSLPLGRGGVIDPGAVVAHESVDEPEHRGGCVVFADGHGECMTA